MLDVLAVILVGVVRNDKAFRICLVVNWFRILVGGVALESVRVEVQPGGLALKLPLVHIVSTVVIAFISDSIVLDLPLRRTLYALYLSAEICSICYRHFWAATLSYRSCRGAIVMSAR